MGFHKIIFSFIAFFMVQDCLAQGGASIKASVDKNKILIGEPVQLTVEAHLSPEAVITFVSIDTINHFELLEKPVLDTITENGGTTIKGIYKLTSFDSGHWVIPSFSLSAAAQTDTIPMDVVFSDFDPEQDYHDIKDILEVHPAKKNERWWWYVAAGALLLALIIFYLARKKKIIKIPVTKEVTNPYEEAMKQLGQLQKEKPEIKQFYSKLTDIFRLYVFRKKGLLSLQKTTDDLIVQLQTIELNKEQMDKLAQSLRLGDFVKFAKYVPASQDDQMAFDEIKNAIIAIEKSETKVSSSGKS